MAEIQSNKAWWTSKMLWTNTIAFIVIILNAMYEWIQITTAEEAAIVGGILAVINIVLRVITRTALMWRRAK